MSLMEPSSGIRRQIEADLDQALPGGGTSVISPRLVLDRFRARGIQAWVAGGAVRNWLEGRPALDVDVSCQEHWTVLLRLLQEDVPGGTILAGPFPAMGTFRWGCAGHGIDVNMLRTLPVIAPGRPIYQQAHVLASTVEEDASLRDFTLNALYFDPVSGRIQDPSRRGLKALAHRRIELNCSREVAEVCPYLAFRMIKFIGRGYVPDPEASAWLKGRCDRDLQRAGGKVFSLWLEKQIVEKGDDPGAFIEVTLGHLQDAKSRRLLEGVLDPGSGRRFMTSKT